MTLERFFGLNAQVIDQTIFHAVHMFAVYSCVNYNRRLEQVPDEHQVDAIIWNGHRKAPKTKGICGGSMGYMHSDKSFGTPV